MTTVADVSPSAELEGGLSSPLASSLAMSTGSSDPEARATTHQVPTALRLVGDEPEAPINIDQVVLVQMVCAVATLQSEVRALKRRISYLEGAARV